MHKIFFCNEKSKNKGFTLIELLVVIAIIGILASVVLISLNTARARSRNVRRLSDIKQLVNAFSLGFNEVGSFPTYSHVGGSEACLSTSCYGSWSSFPAKAPVDAFFTPYISKPSDPVDGTRGLGGYLYDDSFSGGPSFPLGAYLDYAVEPPLTATSCGYGQVWSSTANYIDCLLKID